MVQEAMLVVGLAFLVLALFFMSPIYLLIAALLLVGALGLDK